MLALDSLMSAPVSGHNLSGSGIAKKTKAALEPNVPSTRILAISIIQVSKRTAQWTKAQAHAAENGARYMVTAQKLMHGSAKRISCQPEDSFTIIPALWFKARSMPEFRIMTGFLQ
jgi:hypothetical protein